MVRAWHGVVGAAALGAIVAVVLRASTGAARSAPSARSALGADDRFGGPLADEPDQPTRRTVTRRPGPDSESSPTERRAGRPRNRTGERAPKRRGHKAKANVWTVPHGRGWANRREGAERVAKVFPTKDAAQAAGRATAMREKVEHVILKRDGRIGERTSYGGDPARPKG